MDKKWNIYLKKFKVHKKSKVYKKLITSVMMWPVMSSVLNGGKKIINKYSQITSIALHQVNLIPSAESAVKPENFFAHLCGTCSFF